MGTDEAAMADLPTSSGRFWRRLRTAAVWSVLGWGSLRPGWGSLRPGWGGPGRVGTGRPAFWNGQCPFLSHRKF